MPTNNERRCVAAALRRIRDTRQATDGERLWCDLFQMLTETVPEGAGYRCSGICDDCELTVLDMLADLIEPMPKPVCLDASDVFGRFKCSECGCVIYDISQVDFGMVNYCPDCGRWVEVD